MNSGQVGVCEGPRSGSSLVAARFILERKNGAPTQGRSDYLREGRTFFAFRVAAPLSGLAMSAVGMIAQRSAPRTVMMNVAPSAACFTMSGRIALASRSPIRVGSFVTPALCTLDRPMSTPDSVHSGKGGAKRLRPSPSKFPLELLRLRCQPSFSLHHHLRKGRFPADDALIKKAPPTRNHPSVPSGTASARGVIFWSWSKDGPWPRGDSRCY